MRILLDRWSFLATSIAWQIHGACVAVHDHAHAGLLILEGVDGHATRSEDLLLTVSVADCIPIYVVDAGRRAIGLLHAGWRGLAAGIVEAGISKLCGTYGCKPGELRVHFGPAICGACYEVGPEVHEQLGLLVPVRPMPLDLVALAVARGAGGRRARRGDQPLPIMPALRASRFFSHCAGSAGRQMAVLGLRSD